MFIAGLICGFVDSILKVLVSTAFSHSLTFPCVPAPPFVAYQTLFAHPDMVHSAACLRVTKSVSGIAASIGATKKKNPIL